MRGIHGLVSSTAALCSISEQTDFHHLPPLYWLSTEQYSGYCRTHSFRQNSHSLHHTRCIYSQCSVRIGLDVPSWKDEVVTHQTLTWLSSHSSVSLWQFCPCCPWPCGLGCQSVLEDIGWEKSIGSGLHPCNMGKPSSMLSEDISVGLLWGHAGSCQHSLTHSS